ncbi:MAG: DUF1667 domain-containing protein [Longicatena sp.]
MKELICIVCPKGCHLKVDESNDFKVTGNTCPRGADYGKKELTHPTRMITSTIRVEDSLQSRVSIKTSHDVDKKLIWDIMERLNALCVQVPVHRGDIVEKNICNSGADIIITKDIDC